ncbi:putative glutamate-5-semialdehyde dehydrogenase, Glutamate 5-kinase [Medicago truncatula]|uniref:Delta-1-pyrroline-5-carboxylate synthase n=1 Tax=Medicago truncatula TaxID=3880 RepID=H0UST0_MEDTR|nr:delta-1-pyrroline-5-carboxylate synthase isoform X1 [Medicago truncatula]AET87351.1 delta-1-pyrroline-5-carboxylate synthetase 2 [Medicago truncatula]AET87352.1 delta-1-pyrroline-5-carboxylate synthetase 2 [Medicago truncatula]RHN46210.1 putative glutamate-5-semialdehyde dehydrogenase, Glutamate 5-kinase [Medicago truncatula]
MDPTRAFVKSVKRVVVKVGTAVVTRSDGRLALGRLGALCEQLKELNTRGYEVILVTSGAVGLGRQRLRYRRLANSSFSDLQNPQYELDGKACAAVGQSSLMALYDIMFSQLDVTSSQLLVNDGFFRDADFRKQLTDTVHSLLELRVIPIFNENDAVSTRKAPYELLQDSSGIFWDNDSLAGLLALELKADLLVLLSDVEGLYNGPPSDPKSKLIHTYVREKHQTEITFGDKSRLGRGGMTAKVNAAVCAAYSGTPVIITSGYPNDNIMRVLQGERIGTVFHKDAHLWTSIKEITAHEMAVAARDSSRKLQILNSEQRKKILLDVAAAIEKNESEIRLENASDVADAEEAGYERSLISRLTLRPEKIASLVKSVRKLAEMDEPIGQILKRTEIADKLVLEKISCPLGVLLVIFESRPDALVQIAALAIRSGNGLLLKGGKEAKRSNAVLHKIITSAIPDTVGGKLIGLVTSREAIPDLLKLDDVIDLVVPRGSNKLVSQIKDSTKIPVLGHADGICHVYIDKAANINVAKKIVKDAKTDYPAACNAMETLLVHKDLAGNGGLNELVAELQKQGVQLYGGPKASVLLKISEAKSFHLEYSSLACTIEIVDDVFAAIDHIHEYGSSHTDCIVTEDSKVAETFLHQVDSAAVFHNASTRFCDGARFGLGAEVGISTSRIHARGPVGVEGLLTNRWVLRGNGQVVDGDRSMIYTHKDLQVKA